jgi:hypothetical protein
VSMVLASYISPLALRRRHGCMHYLRCHLVIAPVQSIAMTWRHLPPVPSARMSLPHTRSACERFGILGECAGQKERFGFQRATSIHTGQSSLAVHQKSHVQISVRDSFARCISSDSASTTCWPLSQLVCQWVPHMGLMYWAFGSCNVPLSGGILYSGGFFGHVCARRGSPELPLSVYGVRRRRILILKRLGAYAKTAWLRGAG